MDASIGLIMQKLKDVGLDNNTFVIFTRYVCNIAIIIMCVSYSNPSFVSKLLLDCVCVSPIATLLSFQNSYLTVCVCLL